MDARHLPEWRKIEPDDILVGFTNYKYISALLGAGLYIYLKWCNWFKLLRSQQPKAV
jgi:hypothetical protein